MRSRAKAEVSSNRLPRQPADLQTEDRTWRLYLGQHGQMLVLDDGGSVGRQAALFQTGKQVVQVHAGDREREKEDLVTAGVLQVASIKPQLSSHHKGHR